MPYDTKNIDEVESLLKQQKSDLDEFIKTAGGQLKEFKGTLETETRKLHMRVDDMVARWQAPDMGGGSRKDFKTVGGRFVDDDVVKSVLDSKRYWRKGELLRAPAGSFWQHHKTTITTGNVGEGVIQPATQPGIVQAAAQPLRVRDLMVAVPAMAPVIQFIRENGFTNAASPQVEAQAKAESALNFSLENATARTIAHWIPATRQVLDDMSGLRTYIDMRLMYGLKLVEEVQILAGDGTGENLDGIIPQATAYDTGLTVGGDTKIDLIRRAILQAELADEAVDGIVLHPTDVADMDLSKDAEDRYLLVTPNGVAQFRTLWNKPVVSSRSISAGTFLVGAFGTAAKIHDRMEATIDLSSEHSDFFTRNLVAIRAEERVALTVERPGAFIYGAF